MRWLPGRCNRNKDQRQSAAVGARAHKFQSVVRPAGATIEPSTAAFVRPGVRNASPWHDPVAMVQKEAWSTSQGRPRQLSPEDAESSGAGEAGHCGDASNSSETWPRPQPDMATALPGYRLAIALNLRQEEVAAMKIQSAINQPGNPNELVGPGASVLALAVFSNAFAHKLHKYDFCSLCLCVQCQFCAVNNLPPTCLPAGPPARRPLRLSTSR